MSNAAQFLQAIVPKDALTCIAHTCTYPNPGNRKIKWAQRFFTPEQVDAGEAVAYIDQHNQRGDIDLYVGVASYRARERSKLNASSLSCVLLDIDLKGDRPHYKTKLEAIQGLLNLYKEVQALPKPWIIDSGHGVHAYFTLNKPITVAEWEPLAAVFAKVVEDVDPKLLSDPKPTKDAARVMRLPGTWNAKARGKVWSKILGGGEPTKYDELLAGLTREAKIRNVWVSNTLPDSTPLILGSAPPHHAFASDPVPLGQGFTMQRRFVDLHPGPITRGCRPMREMMAARGNVAEPEWVLMLRVINTMQKSDELAQTFSNGHPTYTRAATRRKMEHIRQSFSAASASCDEFREQMGDAICRGCKFRKKVWTPSQIPERVERIEREEKQAADALTRAHRGWQTDDGCIEQPARYTQVWSQSTAERLTMLPVFKGKDEGEQAEPLVHAHFKLRGATEEIDTDETGEDTRRGLMIHLEVQVWNNTFKLAVPMEVLTSSNIDIATKPLRKVGVAFRNNNHNETVAIREYLGWLARAGSANPRPYYSIKGWARHALTLGARRYQPSGKVIEGVTYQEHVRGKQRPIEKFCAGRANGNITMWKQAVGVYNGDYPYAHLILLSGLANTLFPLMTDMQGGILLALTGESGAGKTTLMRFMNSFIGNPTEGIVQGDSTVNALMDMLKQSGVFMLPVDDMLAMSPENLTHLLTTVTSGKARLRMEQDATGTWAPSDTVSLNASLLLTSNYSAAAAFMAGRKRGDQLQVEAAQTRQLEIPSDLCVVEDVGLERWNRSGRLILEHNGHALEKFAKHVVAHRGIVEAKLDKHRRMFNQLLAARLQGSVVGQYRFWVRWLAAVITTAEVCRELNLVPWSVRNMVAAGVELACTQDEVTEQTQTSDMDVLWDILTDDDNGRININLSEFSVTDAPTWPDWKDTHSRAKRGQLRQWQHTGGQTNMFAQITDRVVNGPKWRVLATEVYEKGDLVRMERSVEIQLTTLRSLVASHDQLAADSWEELHRALTKAGAVVCGVRPSRPNMLTKPPLRLYLKHTRGNTSNPTKAIEIIFPPIPMGSAPP